MAASGLSCSTARAAAAWVRWKSTKPRYCSWAWVYSSLGEWSRTKSMKARVWSASAMARA